MREVVPQIGAGLRQTLIPTGKTTPFDAMIEASAAKYGQDPNVIRAIIEKESGFRPGVTGTSGEQGLMQIMPSTAAQYGGAGKNLFDAATNIELGTKIFADLMRRFNGDIDKALTAYNAGPGRGGIPLPTGPNATYAPDVRRLIPRGPGDVLEQTAAQRRAAELAVEAEKPDTERRAQIMATGREFLRAQEEQERQADVAARERRQQAFATGQEYIRGLDAEIAKQAQQMATLQRLAETYGEVKAARDGDTASALEAALANTVHADKAKELATAIREVAQIEAQLPELRRQAAASAPAGELALKRVKDETDALRVLEENLEQSRISRHEGGFPFGRTREELRLQQRTQEDIRTPEGQQRAQQIQQLRQEQEKLNYAVGIYGQLVGAAEQAWGGVLDAMFAPGEEVDRVRLSGYPCAPGRSPGAAAGSPRVASRTPAGSPHHGTAALCPERGRGQSGHSRRARRTGTRFRRRGKPHQTRGGSRSRRWRVRSSNPWPKLRPRKPLEPCSGWGQDCSPLASRVELAVESGARSAVGAGINPIMFQHGGMINAPTMAMIGENPAHNPESHPQSSTDAKHVWGQRVASRVR